VLFFEQRPFAISEIKYLHWETPSAAYFETTNQQ